MELSQQAWYFIVLAIGAIATAVGTITRRNPVSAAMNLVAHFFMLSGLYLTLQAQFVAVVQILVYAGAIMVLVVFVIMLLNIGKEEQSRDGASLVKLVGIAMALTFALVVGKTVSAGNAMLTTGLSPDAIKLGTTENIGTVLFGQYLLPFEVISLLLLAALVGAVILAKRKIE